MQPSNPNDIPMQLDSLQAPHDGEEAGALQDDAAFLSIVDHDAEYNFHDYPQAELARHLATFINFLDLHSDCTAQDGSVSSFLAQLSLVCCRSPDSNILRFFGARLLFLVHAPAAALALLRDLVFDQALPPDSKAIHMWYLFDLLFEGDDARLPLLPDFVAAALLPADPALSALQFALIDRIGSLVITMPPGSIPDPYLDCLPHMIAAIAQCPESQLAAVCIDCVTDFVKRGPFLRHRKRLTDFLVSLAQPSNLFFVSGLYALGLWLGRLSEMDAPEQQLSRVAKACISSGLAALSTDIADPLRSMVVHCLERVIMYAAHLEPSCSDLFLPVFSNLPFASGAQGNVVARVANERGVEILQEMQDQLLIPGAVEPLIETFLEQVIQPNDLISDAHRARAILLLQEKKSQMANTTAASA